MLCSTGSDEAVVLQGGQHGTFSSIALSVSSRVSSPFLTERLHKTACSGAAESGHPLAQLALHLIPEAFYIYCHRSAIMYELCRICLCAY